MKVRMLLECALVTDLVEKHFESFKAEHCAYEDDAVNGRTEKEKKEDAIKDLNEMFEECVNLCPDLEDGEALMQMGEMGELVYEITLSVMSLIPTAQSIKVADDLLNLIVEAELNDVIE